MDLPIRQTLADAVDLLQSRRINHALIGGLATSLRGMPRVTADVDIVIASDVETSIELSRDLGGTKFRPLFADVEDVISTSFLLPIRHRITNVKVDLVIGMTGFERAVVSRAQARLIGDCAVAVASAEDLLIMKTLAGRPRDDQDLQGLVIAQGATLDWEYCRKVATELGDVVGQNLAERIRALQEWQKRI